MPAATDVQDREIATGNCSFKRRFAHAPVVAFLLSGASERRQGTLGDSNCYEPLSALRGHRTGCTSSKNDFMDLYSLLLAPATVTMASPNMRACSGPDRRIGSRWQCTLRHAEPQRSRQGGAFIRFATRQSESICAARLGAGEYRSQEVRSH